MSSPTSEGVVPWPAEEAAEYRRLGYWQDRALGEYVLDVAASHPDKIAVVSGTTRFTYRELVNRMDAAAERLLALGLRPDDRLLMQLPNDWTFVVLTLACFRSGVIPVMAVPAHRRFELSHLAAHSEAVAIAVQAEIKGFDHVALAREVIAENPGMRWVLAAGDPPKDTVDLTALLEPTDDPATRARVDALAPDPGSPACFLLSGGTTGLPKLITRTHNDYAYNVRATSEISGMTEDTVYLGTLPTSHNFPLACPGVLGALFAGGTSVMLPSPEPVRAFATIAAEHVTMAAAVPAVAQRWLEHAREVGSEQVESLQVLQVGGSRMPDELAMRVGPELGATLQQVFGMAEGLINMTRLDDPLEVIVHTQGRPVSPSDEVRVVGHDGVDVPRGGRGLIITRGPYTPRGYYRAAEHNSRTFVDGWYGSGDVVIQRPDGNLIVLGRDKDIVNRGGEKISAEEVENIVYGLDQVDLVAAVGTPDPVLGERLCLCVILKPGGALDLEGVRDFMLGEGLAAFKLPDRLEIVDSLPMTNVGKIDKRAIRDALVDRVP